MHALILSIALSMAVIGSAQAAGADTLRVNQIVRIDAPAAKVWSQIKDFDGWQSWHPAVSKTDIVEGHNNQRDAVRILTLQDGTTITERLGAYKPKAMRYQYQILQSALPVSQYISTLSVKAQGDNRSVVIWQGRFKRKDPSSNPATGADDATAIQAITAVYRSGLDNLKKVVE